MKNIKNYLASQLILLVGILIILSSCKKESIQVAEKSNLDSKNLNKEIQKSKTLDLEHSIAKSLAKIYAGNHDFSKALKNLCLQQKYGDYYIRLSELFTDNSLQKFASPNQIESITSLVKQMKAANSGREPIIFIPSVENSDPKIIASNSISKLNSNGNAPVLHTGRGDDEIIYVFGEEGGVDNELYPGYTLDEFGELIYYGMISESFAWGNDVAVIGIEEESSYIPDGTEPTATKPIKVLSPRDPSRLEIGGRIMVTDMKMIESWPRGKLEMKYFVNSSTATLIKQRAFAPIRRADVRNVWLDLNDPIGSWDTNVWGPQQYERWIEEDGGESTQTISTPITPIAGGQTYTISTTKKIGDNDCGLAAVGYNDPYYWEIPYAPASWRIYYISYMNFQRENRQ